MMAQPGGPGGEEEVEGGGRHRQQQQRRNDDEAWRRWAVLVATVWIQALTGTNFDFSAYSSALKSSLGVSQEALNYLATASDLGKALGWSSGLTLLHMPLHAVLMVSAAMGLAAYAVQYYCLVASVAVPYPLVRACRRHCHCLAACPADVRSLRLSRGWQAVHIGLYVSHPHRSITSRLDRFV